MAFVTKRVWAKSNATFLPSGHSVNTSPASIGTVNAPLKPITFSNIDIESSVTTTAAAGCDAIIKTDLVALIDALIETDLAIDTTGQSVSYNAEVLAVNNAGDANDIWLDDATRELDITVKISIAVS